jgi:hypothetical protein
MGFRISLRELLLLLAFSAIACTSLINASVGWAIAIFGGTLLIGLALAIGGLAERGARQAAALGAAFAMVAYGAIWILQPKSEITTTFNAHSQSSKEVLVDSGYLPTSKAIYILWDWVNGTYLIEGNGRVVQRVSPKYSTYAYNVPPSQTPSHWKGDPLISKGLPVPEDFLAIGHCLWALVFAYLGGKLAVWIYQRRVAREKESISRT